mmetsp:Transcript_17954/g.35088  ORF Transcript_17954/g.35088 Transcript_17954/m.35088 type:complete len:99 (+) Transcript_17954:1052-1348(+)
MKPTHYQCSCKECSSSRHALHNRQMFPSLYPSDVVAHMSIADDTQDGKERQAKRYSMDGLTRNARKIRDYTTSHGYACHFPAANRVIDGLRGLMASSQ